MKILSTARAASLFLVTITCACLTFGASVTQRSPDLTHVAFGYCDMNISNATIGALVLPEGSNLYKVSSCSHILKAAAEHGYTSILSTAASLSTESFVLGQEDDPKPTAIVFCSSDPKSTQEGTVDYSDGHNSKDNCSGILGKLISDGYSIVPELTVSSSGRHSHTGYVFVKQKNSK
jgi:hypothetical protein